MDSVCSTPLFGNLLDANSVPELLGTPPVVEIPGKHNGLPTSLKISEELLSKHLMLLGGTGSGKTNLMYHIISQVKPKMSQNDVMVIFDTKGDYYRRFFDQAHRDIVISVDTAFENNTERWNLYREIASDGWDDEHIILNSNEIAWSLFQEAVERNKNQPFFPKAARDLFAAIIIHFLRVGGDDRAFKIKYYNNQALRRYLDIATPEKVNAILKGEADLAAVKYYIGDGNNNQSLGVFAELQQTIRSIFVGAFAGNGSFSIRDFVRKREGRTLFIEYDLSSGSVLTPIYRLLIDLALKEAMNRNQKHGNVYVICDEFKLLPYLQHIEDAVNFGRSFGVKVIAGLQSVSQLFELYGESRGRSIMSGFSTVASFHLNDVVSRNYIRDLYGKNLILEQFSAADGSIVEEKRQGNTVEDWDIQRLSLGEAIIGFPFRNPFRFQIDLFK